MTATRTTHFRTCHLCEAMCGVAVEVEGDKVVSVRGDDADPFSRGHICPKAPALAELHEDPDRLRTPMLRTASGFVPVSWEQALDAAAAGLHAVQKTHGLSAVATYLGNPTVHNHGAALLAPVLVRSLRTRNRYSATSADQLPHQLASYFMLGHQLLFPIPDVDRTRFVLMFGANPLASMGSIMTAPGIKERLRGIQKRGGRIVVVDPRRTETAELADEHVFIRPASDVLLLLALLHVVLREHAPRLRHLDKLVRGLGEVAALVTDFTPERVAGPTGVPAATTRRLAAELYAADPGLVYGRIGVSTQAFGVTCQWLIQTLNIVTGNFDRAGGAMFTRPAVDALAAAAGIGIGRGSYGRWKSRVRGFPEAGGELPVATMAEDMLAPGDGQIRGLLTVAGNPALSTPNGGQLDRALEGLEFMVSVDSYLNETTRRANVILPPISALERSHYDAALHVVAVRNTAKWSPPIFPKPADGKDDWEILVELKRRIEARRGPSLRDRLENAPRPRPHDRPHAARRSLRSRPRRHVAGQAQEVTARHRSRTPRALPPRAPAQRAQAYRPGAPSPRQRRRASPCAPRQGDRAARPHRPAAPALQQLLDAQPAQARRRQEPLHAAHPPRRRGAPRSQRRQVGAGALARRRGQRPRRAVR